MGAFILVLVAGIGLAVVGYGPLSLKRHPTAGAVVEEPSPVLPRSMISCRFPITDGAPDSEGVLEVAIRTLVSLLENRIPTLVCCSAGMSRSPALAAAAFAIVRGANPKERLQEIVANHPHDVSPQLWAAVRGLCSKYIRHHNRTE